MVLVENAGRSASDLRELATYLSSLGVAGCEVVILDPAPRPQFELGARTLRWVGRHVTVRADHWSAGVVDVVRAAAAVASCEKVIVANDDVRYTREAIEQVCDLLETHEIVEPQDYLDPMPWWGGIEAGRILIHRGIDGQPDHGATFGFRASAIRVLRTLAATEIHDDPVRRLASVGAEIHPASAVFVRRKPGELGEWVEKRPRVAGDDFILPIKTAFFFSLLPLLVLLAVAGGARMAMGYATLISFSAIALALRGRAGGARAFFPLHAALFAALWVFERSVSVYWALFRKLLGTGTPSPGVAVSHRDTKVASGE